MIPFIFRWFHYRFILHIFDSVFMGFGMAKNISKSLEQEYHGNKSWENGKREATGVLTLCIILLIFASWLIPYLFKL